MRIKLTNNIIACTAILCILFSIWSNYIVYRSTSFTGMDVSTGEGRISLCVNAPPTLSISCSSSATAGSAYNCDIDATDSNSGQTHAFGDNTSLFDINSVTGVISFTPASAQVGSYSINISVNDSSGCVNNFGSSVFSLTISSAAAPPPEEAPKAAGAAGGGGGGGACSSAWECGDWGSCTDNTAARICKDIVCGKPEKTELTACGFVASPMIMRVLIKTGEKLIEQLKITNTGNTPLNITIEKKNLDFVSFSQDNFRLEAGEEKAINVIFDTKTLQPDVYVGKIIVKGDNVEEEITTIAEVESRLVLFDVSLDIPAKYRKIYPGDEILAQITLINLAKIGLTNVSMVYYVKDLEGNLILSEEETIAVETEASYEKRFLIPKGTKLGDYVLIVQTRYKDSFGMSSELFQITSLEMPAPKDYTMWLLLIIGLLLAIFALLIYERLRLKEKGKEKKEDKREIKLEKERIAKEKLQIILDRKDRLRKEGLEAGLRKKERIRQEREEKIRKAAELRKQLEEQRENERVKRAEEKKKEAEEERIKRAELKEQLTGQKRLEAIRIKEERKKETEERIRKSLVRKRLAKAKRRKIIFRALHALGLRKTKEELEEIRQRKLKTEEESRRAREEKRRMLEVRERLRLEKEKRREEEKRKSEEERKEREAEIKKERQEEKAKIEERIRERENRLKEIQLERERLKSEKLRIIEEARERERLKSEEEREELKEELEKKKKLREENIREKIELGNKLREQRLAEKLKIKEEKERRRKEMEQLKEKKLRERIRLEKELEKRKNILEEKRKAEEEAKRLAEEKRKIEEEKKAEEERRRAEREDEERRLEEERKELDERKKAEEEERRKRLEKEYKKKKEKLLKQLNILEEGYKSEFISEESYEKDKEKITNELNKIEVRITNE